MESTYGRSHIELKNFALSQLKESVKSDCNIYEYDIVKFSPELYKKNKIKQLMKDFDFYKREDDNEIKRTNDRNKWILDLKNSFLKQEDL